MLTGLLLKESLQDTFILDALRITKTEVWQVQNATPNQPSIWTALSFETDDSQADMLAEAMSQALKPKGWFINASTEEHVYVMFPRQVFKYRKGDNEQRSAAVEFGRGCEIPEQQLDWSE